MIGAVGSLFEFEERSGYTGALLKKYEVEAGQIWSVGRQKILCGDVEERGCHELVGGASPALITDPPYGKCISSEHMGRRRKDRDPAIVRLGRAADWDSARPDITWATDYREAIVWGWNYFSDLLPPTNSLLCWNKKTAGTQFSEFELAWTNLKLNAKRIDHSWTQEIKLHPAQKPLKVMDWCVKFTSGLVVDPYCGSGTTLLACEINEREGCGIEREPIYVAIALERLKKLTGETPKLIGREP